MTIVLTSAMMSSYDVINMSHDMYGKVIHAGKIPFFNYVYFSKDTKNFVLRGVDIPKMPEGLRTINSAMLQ